MQANGLGFSLIGWTSIGTGPQVGYSECAAQAEG